MPFEGPLLSCLLCDASEGAQTWHVVPSASISLGATSRLIAAMIRRCHLLHELYLQIRHMLVCLLIIAAGAGYILSAMQSVSRQSKLSRADPGHKQPFHRYPALHSHFAWILFPNHSSTNASVCVCVHGHTCSDMSICPACATQTPTIVCSLVCRDCLQL